jgi:hypothetical protein
MKRAPKSSTSAAASTFLRRRRNSRRRRATGGVLWLVGGLMLVGLLPLGSARFVSADGGADADCTPIARTELIESVERSFVGVGTTYRSRLMLRLVPEGERIRWQGNYVYPNADSATAHVKIPPSEYLNNAFEDRSDEPYTARMRVMQPDSSWKEVVLNASFDFAKPEVVIRTVP